MGKAMVPTGGVGGELGLRALSVYTWHIILFLIYVGGIRGPAEAPTYGNPRCSGLRTPSHQTDGFKTI